jgi:hypothetical protein
MQKVERVHSGVREVPAASPFVSDGYLDLPYGFDRLAVVDTGALPVSDDCRLHYDLLAG